MVQSPLVLGFEDSCVQSESICQQDCDGDGCFLSGAEQLWKLDHHIFVDAQSG